MNHLKEKIKETYTGVVQNPGTSCCGTASNNIGGCCGTSDDLSRLNEDYRNMPGYNPDADYGLGCGIPVAYADIEKGHTVLDLGSGAGNDVFIARSLVGETGKVIGIDMTPAMIQKANENKRKLGYDNVDFILADIENIPLESHSIDVVISNCVLNLVSDKAVAYKGIHKVLKEKGHFSISDIVLSGPLSPKMEGIVDLYAGCIAGAMEKSAYIKVIEKAGFKQVEIKKEKIMYLPDSFLLQYLSEEELIEFRSSGVQVLSITVNGKK